MHFRCSRLIGGEVGLTITDGPSCIRRMTAACADCRPSRIPWRRTRLRRNRPFVERAKTDGAHPAEIPPNAISLRSILPSRATFASEHERRPDSGWANSGGFFGSSIAISARRSATARPIVGSFFSSSKAPVINLKSRPRRPTNATRGSTGHRRKEGFSQRRPGSAVPHTH
jgi:hypothetical protein